MHLTRRDMLATLLTALAVVVLVAAQQGWGIPLVGDSYRWAAAAVLVLGVCAFLAGEPLEGSHEPVLGVLGVIALSLGVLALATGSLTFLALLVATTVALWAGATLRHQRYGQHGSIAA